MNLNELISDMGRKLDQLTAESQKGAEANLVLIKELQESLAQSRLEVESVKEALAEEKKRVLQAAMEQKSLGQTIFEDADIQKVFKRKAGTSNPVHYSVNPLDGKAISYAPAPGTRETSSDIRQWGALYNYPNILRDPERPPTIRERMNVVSTTDQFIQYVREVSKTNAAAVVAETSLKPESAIGMQMFQTPIQTIATWIPAPLQLMDDLNRFQNYVETRLMEFMRTKTEDLYLYGAGGDVGSINGMLTDDDIPVLTQVEGVNRFDTLRLAVVMLEEEHYVPDTLVIHPRDRYFAEIQKGTSNDHYLLMPMLGLNGLETMLRIKVVSTTAINKGTALLGNFKRGVTLFVRDGVDITVSFEHADYFIRNMMAIRCECREQTVIEYPKAFVRVNWLGDSY